MRIPAIVFSLMLVATCAKSQEYLPFASAQGESLTQEVNEIVGRYAFDLKFDADRYVNTTLRIEQDSLNRFNFGFSKPSDAELINRLIRISPRAMRKSRATDQLIRFIEIPLSLTVIHKTVTIKKVNDAWVCASCDEQETSAINEDAKKTPFEYSGNRGKSHVYRITNTTFNGSRSIKAVYYGVSEKR